jgi:hypothetical protein
LIEPTNHRIRGRIAADGPVLKKSLPHLPKQSQVVDDDHFLSAAVSADTLDFLENRRIAAALRGSASAVMRVKPREGTGVAAVAEGSRQLAGGVAPHQFDIGAGREPAAGLLVQVLAQLYRYQLAEILTERSNRISHERPGLYERAQGELLRYLGNKRTGQGARKVLDGSILKFHKCAFRLRSALAHYHISRA